MAKRRSSGATEGDASQFKIVLKTGIKHSPGMANLIKAMFQAAGNEVNDPEGPAREFARKLATDVALLLGGTVAPSRQNVINLTVDEPLYPFAIHVDTKQFRSVVRIADSHYSLSCKHRKGQSALLGDAVFCVSFKFQDRVMFTKDRVAAVSKALGVAVYRQGFVEDGTVARYLLQNSVRESLAKVDFNPLVRLILSPIQLEVTSRIRNASETAEQVRTFMELMDTLASARKPEKPKGKARKQDTA